MIDIGIGFERIESETDDEDERLSPAENCGRCGRFVAWKDFTEERWHARQGGVFLDGWVRGHRAGTGCRKDEEVDNG